MKELLKYMIRFEIYSLFIKPTNNRVIHFFRYIFIGGFAFFIDTVILISLESLGLHYLLSAAIGFIVGLIINYLLSKRFIFTNKAKVNSKEAEIFIYSFIGLIGLFLTETLMYFITDVLNIYYVFSKIIVAIIILLWNFMARNYLYNK